MTGFNTWEYNFTDSEITAAVRQLLPARSVFFDIRLWNPSDLAKKNGTRVGSPIGTNVGSTFYLDGQYKITAPSSSSWLPSSSSSISGQELELLRRNYDKFFVDSIYSSTSLGEYVYDTENYIFLDTALPPGLTKKDVLTESSFQVVKSASTKSDNSKICRSGDDLFDSMFKSPLIGQYSPVSEEIVVIDSGPTGLTTKSVPRVSCDHNKSTKTSFHSNTYSSALSDPTLILGTSFDVFSSDGPYPCSKLNFELSSRVKTSCNREPMNFSSKESGANNIKMLYSAVAKDKNSTKARQEIVFKDPTPKTTPEKVTQMKSEIEKQSVKKESIKAPESKRVVPVSNSKKPGNRKWVKPDSKKIASKFTFQDTTTLVSTTNFSVLADSGKNDDDSGKKVNKNKEKRGKAAKKLTVDFEMKVVPEDKKKKQGEDGIIVQDNNSETKKNQRNKKKKKESKTNQISWSEMTVSTLSGENPTLVNNNQKEPDAEKCSLSKDRKQEGLELEENIGQDQKSQTVFSSSLRAFLGKIKTTVFKTFCFVIGVIVNFFRTEKREECENLHKIEECNICDCLEDVVVHFNDSLYKMEHSEEGLVVYCQKSQEDGTSRCFHKTNVHTQGIAFPKNLVKDSNDMQKFKKNLKLILLRKLKRANKKTNGKVERCKVSKVKNNENVDGANDDALQLIGDRIENNVVEEIVTDQIESEKPAESENPVEIVEVENANSDEVVDRKKVKPAYKLVKLFLAEEIEQLPLELEENVSSDTKSKRLIATVAPNNFKNGNTVQRQNKKETVLNKSIDSGCVTGSSNNSIQSSSPRVSICWTEEEAGTSKKQGDEETFLESVSEASQLNVANENENSIRTFLLSTSNVHDLSSSTVETEHEPLVADAEQLAIEEPMSALEILFDDDICYCDTCTAMRIFFNWVKFYRPDEHEKTQKSKTKLDGYFVDSNFLSAKKVMTVILHCLANNSVDSFRKRYAENQIILEDLLVQNIRYLRFMHANNWNRPEGVNYTNLNSGVSHHTQTVAEIKQYITQDEFLKRFMEVFHITFKLYDGYNHLMSTKLSYAFIIFCTRFLINRVETNLVNLCCIETKLNRTHQYYDLDTMCEIHGRLSSNDGEPYNDRWLHGILRENFEQHIYHGQDIREFTKFKLQLLNGKCTDEDVLKVFGLKNI